MILVQEIIEREVISREMATIGRRLRSARKRKGWTMREAAPELGISLTFLCDLENGKTRISADRLHEAAKALGLTMGQLFKGL